MNIHDVGRGAPKLWITRLTLVTAGVALAGFALVLAPSAARAAFSALIYADTDRIDSFGPLPVAYISLAHAVLGAVLLGWGLALLLILRGPFARGARESLVDRDTVSRWVVYHGYGLFVAHEVLAERCVERGSPDHVHDTAGCDLSHLSRQWDALMTCCRQAPRRVWDHAAPAE
jgi:hypothetical protein